MWEYEHVKRLEGFIYSKDSEGIVMCELQRVNPEKRRGGRREPYNLECSRTMVGGPFDHG